MEENKLKKQSSKNMEKKSAKHRKVKPETEQFNFDNEIIIGVTKIEEPKKKKEKKKKTPKQPKKIKDSKKKEKSREKEANTEQFNFDNEIIIGVTKIEEPKKKKEKKKKEKKIKQAKKSKEDKKQEKIERKRKVKPNKKIDLVKERKKRRILSFLKGIAIITVLLGGTLGIALSPLFKLEKIETEGNVKIASEEIITLSEIEVGENIFLVNNNKAINKVLKNSYIEEVKINKQLPDKIVIKVKERKATYCIEYEGKYIYINNQGYILELAETNAGLPQIIFANIKAEDMEPGARLPKEKLELLGTILRIMESANGNGIGNLITIIDLTNKSNIKIVLETEGKTVYLGGTTDINTRILYVKAILEEEKGVPGEIILSNEIGGEKGVVFRRQV